jgi:hypothetical protein
VLWKPIKICKPIYQLETVITESRLADLFANTGQQEEGLIHHKNMLNRLKYLFIKIPTADKIAYEDKIAPKCTIEL